MKQITRELIIKQNNQLVRHIPLTNRNMTIGRDKFCDIILRDKTVSKRHAMILNDADASYIEDMNSTNSTQVNSQEIQQHKLQDNDVIVIGHFQLHFRQEAYKTRDESKQQTVTQTA